MFLFLLIPALVVLGVILIAGPALLPFAIIAAVVLVVWRAVIRHRHPDETLHGH